MLDVGEAPCREAASEFAADVLAAANIHPVSRLATDYLNHFNNVVMLLDLVPSMPDCIDEVLEWQPMDYCSYFAASRFRERELAIRAFHAADPEIRKAFETVVNRLDAAVIEAQTLLTTIPHTDPAFSGRLRDLVRGQMQPLIAEAGGIVNGHVPEDRFEEESSTRAQESIDELFV